MPSSSDPYRYVGEKLLEPAGPGLWPLAVLYFNPETRGLTCAVASTGAELIVGHGRKIGVIIESSARELCRQERASRSGSARGGAPATTPEPPSPPLDAGPAESA